VFCRTFSIVKEMDGDVREVALGGDAAGSWTDVDGSVSGDLGVFLDFAAAIIDSRDTGPDDVEDFAFLDVFERYAAFIE
jgi:hypothetical protein